MDFSEYSTLKKTMLRHERVHYYLKKRMDRKLSKLKELTGPTNLNELINYFRTRLSLASTVLIAGYTVNISQQTVIFSIVSDDKKLEKMLYDEIVNITGFNYNFEIVDFGLYKLSIRTRV